MSSFMKIGEVVEAIQFTGHNDEDCLSFCTLARDPGDRKGNLILPTLVEEVLVNKGDWIVKNCFGHFKRYTTRELLDNYNPVNEILSAGPLEFKVRSDTIPTIDRSEIKTKSEMVPLTIWRPARQGNSGTDDGIKATEQKAASVVEEKMMKMTNGEKMVWAAVFAKHYCDLKEEVAFARFPANKAVCELRGLAMRGECILDRDMELVRAFLEDR
jgi:hypothetical protein